MQPSPDKRMKLQTGVARARMMFKQHLEWLPGFVNEQPEAESSCKWFYFGNDSSVKEKQFTREDLRVAELTVKKLLMRFPRALPKIVDDVDRWQARMSNLLRMLKAWVHDGRPPELDDLLNANQINERWLKQLQASRKSNPKLDTLLNAAAFLQLTGTAEPDLESISWVQANAFALTLISESQHLRQHQRLQLQFKFWQMRKEIPAQFLVTLCRFIASKSAFACPARNQLTAVDSYRRSILKIRVPSPPDLAKELPPIPTQRIGIKVMSVLDSMLLDKPNRRAAIFQMLESFLTPEMTLRACELNRKVKSDEKRLLRILRQFQSGTRLHQKSEIAKAKLASELETCEAETLPQRSAITAFEYALEHLQSSELKPENWLQLLPKIPEDLRCQLFKKWQKEIYGSDHKHADLNFFASKLGELFARRDVPASLVAHWQGNFDETNSDDMVVEACEMFDGNRKIHAATIALLSRLLNTTGQPIASECYASLSSFVDSNKDLDYLTSLILEIGETDQTFWQNEIQVSVEFADSVEQNSQLLNALDNLDQRWEYIDALEGLKPLADSPLLKSAIANLVLNQQISQLQKVHCVTTILKQFDLLESCLKQSGLLRTQHNLASTKNLPAWFDQYPAKFHEALYSLESICEDAASIADSVLGTDFPNLAHLRAQVRPIEAKIASSDPDSELHNRLAVRLGNLKSYLSCPKPVSPTRLKNLHKKLLARVNHEIIQRFIRTGGELTSAELKQKFDVGDLIDKLLAPPYEKILVEILKLPKQDQKLGLRLLFETQGESTSCFDAEPANVAFVEKLKSMSINCEPWLDSEIWEEHTADGKPYQLFFTDNVVDYLLMGFHFQTCLTPGNCNFFSTISNAVDVNKKVLYGKSADGKIIGRCLFALNDSGDILTFHRYQHDESSGFKDAVGRYLKNLTSKMQNDVSTDTNVSSLVSLRWYHDSANPELAGLFDSNSSLAEAFEKAPAHGKLAVLLANVPRVKLIRRFRECISFVAEMECDTFTRDFVEAFCNEQELSFRDRFNLAILAFRSADKPCDSMQHVECLIGGTNIRTIVSFLKRAYCCEFCESFRNVGDYETVYAMLTEYNPTLALRSLRSIRVLKTRSDLDETCKLQRKLLANVHRKLGRDDLASKLDPVKN